MTNLITYLLSILFIYVISAVLGQNLRLLGSAPDLLLIFAVAVTIFRSNKEFISIAILCGLLVDFSSGYYAGFATIIFLLICFLVHTLYHQITFYEFNWKHAPFIIAIAFVGVRLWLYGIFFVLEKFLENSFILKTLAFDSKTIFFGLVYTIIATYPIFLLARIISEFLSLKEQRRKNLY